MTRIDWHSSLIPTNFRETVFHLIARDVFWRYTKLDFTVGHFATKVGGKTYTSYRYDWPDQIQANGLLMQDIAVPSIKPSVLHFHCPKRPALAESGEYQGLIWHYFPEHGPNIYFDATVATTMIINFIETNFALDQRTQALA